MKTLPGYERLAAVLGAALEQAQSGKGQERHAGGGEAFEDQQIVQFGEWLGSTAFAIGQACKKSIESARLPADRARAELLGAINYLAAAVVALERNPMIDYRIARPLVCDHHWLHGSDASICRYCKATQPLGI